MIIMPIGLTPKIDREYHISGVPIREGEKDGFIKK